MAAIFGNRELQHGCHKICCILRMKEASRKASRAALQAKDLWDGLEDVVVGMQADVGTSSLVGWLSPKTVLSQDPKSRTASMWKIKDYSLKSLSVMQNVVMQLSNLKDSNQGWGRSLEFLHFFCPANSLQVLKQRDHQEKYMSCQILAPFSLHSV